MGACWPMPSCATSLGDEVDELLDAAEEGRLEVGIGVDAAEDVLPGPGDVGLVGVRPAERLAHAVLPVGAAWHHRPGVQAEAVGLDRLPHVDIRMPDHEDVIAPRRLVCDVGLLGARYEMVDE